MAGQVVFEDFYDFKGSKYKPLISQVQQLALQKARGEVPVPAKQLELANAKRDKQPRAKHVCKNKFWISLHSSTHETKHSDFHVETLESCIAKELSDFGKRQNAGRMDRTNPEEIKWQECRQPLQCVGQPTGPTEIHNAAWQEFFEQCLVMV